MEKRMLRRLSPRGKRPSRLGWSIGSLHRDCSFAMPISSTISWNRILMKIREAEVVSSSLR
jgi:hypothetical protein